MPWMIVKDGSMFCVHKQNDDKTAGEKIKCHMTKPEAEKHMAALYANMEAKASSLQDQISQVRMAFYEAFPSPPPEPMMPGYYVDDVMDDGSVIVCQGEKMWKVKYSTNAKGEISFEEKSKWQEVEEAYVPVKAREDIMVSMGDAIKADESGHLTGYLIRFSDEKNTDTSGDFFTKSTDFGFEKSIKSPVYLHHCLPVKTAKGKKRIVSPIGEATLTIDENGVKTDAVLYDWLAKSHDEFAASVFNAVKAAINDGYMGWSSGTAPHLVERTKVGKSTRVDKWPLGLDATVTHRPAGIKQGVEVMAMKSVPDIDFGSEATGDVASQKNKSQTTSQGVKAMDETKEQKEAREAAEAEAARQAALKAAPVNTDAFSNALQNVMEQTRHENELKAAEIKKQKDMEESLKELAREFMKSAPAVNGGAPALNLRTKRGDDAYKALNHYIKTGDNGGLRAQPEYKTDYNLVEGTQYQGQELVPTEIAKTVFEMRDPLSVARAGGAQVLQVGSSTVNVPYEKVRQGIMVAPGEVTAYDQLEQQIFDKAAIAITKYTRNIPISEELLEDSVVDLVPYLTRNIARVLAITENAHFITNATGAWYGSTKGLDFDAAAAIGVAEVPELWGKLKPEYRDNMIWIMLPATYAYICALNTAYAFPFVGNGGWSGSLGDAKFLNGAAGMLLGGRVYCPGSVDAIGGGLKSVMVGNLQAGYVICERRQLTIRRDESSLSSGIVKILASTRIGGGVVNAEALQHGLHPTA